MKSKLKISFLLFSLIIVSCGEHENVPRTETPVQIEKPLIAVQQASSGDTYVIVYNTMKDLKPEGSFVIEFHRAVSGENVKVDNVKLDASSLINGKKLTGITTITPSDTAGRYNVDYKIPEKGLWYFNLNFNDSSKVQFIFSVI
jgi:hypothetical protein